MNYLKSRALFNGNLGSCSYFSPDGGCFQHIGLLQMWTWRWKSSIVLPQSISWERAQMTSWWESTDLKLLFRLFCYTSGAFFFFFFFSVATQCHFTSFPEGIDTQIFLVLFWKGWAHCFQGSTQLMRSRKTFLPWTLGHRTLRICAT